MSVNPLIHATVKPERIDQGVDYAGTGEFVSPDPGVITKVLGPSSSGWPGSYIEEQLTGGSHAGQDVYYAEGVNPQVTVGQKVTAGQAIATLIPGWKTGTEIGWASGQGSSTLAASSGQTKKSVVDTPAGQSFSDWIASLGGPPGTGGSGASSATPSTTAASTSTSGSSTATGIDGIWQSIVGKAKYALLLLVVLGMGAYLLTHGFRSA